MNVTDNSDMTETLRLVTHVMMCADCHLQCHNHDIVHDVTVIGFGL